MNAATDFVKALGPARLAAMGAVAAALIGFFAFLMVRLSEPQLSVLFSDLTFEDSADVVQKLEGMNIPYKIRQEGAVILAPKDRVLRLRMKLAEEGLPVGGAVGYEVFDKQDTLGSTNFLQNINWVRAVEGELARTIRSLRQIKTARVHLAIPKRQLFARNATKPSASIIVKTRGDLSPGHIKSIQHLTASAVDGLEPEAVSIVDESGKLLASGNGGAEGAIDIAEVNERNQVFEKNMQREIETIISRIVGPEHVKVHVTAELDYNKITETSDVFDPDGQVVRSSQTRAENSSASQPSGDNTVSVGNELPAADGPEGENSQQKEDTSKTEEVVNYEISRTTKTELIEAGRVKRISVAVLVDGNYAKGDDGNPTYAPRAQEELDKITELVRTAMGYDKERGDLISVTNLRFAPPLIRDLSDQVEESFFNFSKDDYFYMAELGIIFIIAFLVLLFVVRPLVRRIVTGDEDEDEVESGGTLVETIDPITGEKNLVQIEGPKADGGLLTTDQDMAEGSPENKVVEFLKHAKGEGEIHASVIKEVGELIQNNPKEATNVIREWVFEETGEEASKEA